MGVDRWYIGHIGGILGKKAKKWANCRSSGWYNCIFSINPYVNYRVKMGVILLRWYGGMENDSSLTNRNVVCQPSANHNAKSLLCCLRSSNEIHSYE